MQSAVKRRQKTKTYAEKMRDGSAELREAILLSLKGIDPKTAREPVGLPPVGNERGLSDFRKYERRLRQKVNRPAPRGLSNELLFAEYVADGYTPQHAADIVGYACGNAVMQRIRKKLGWQAV